MESAAQAWVSELAKGRAGSFTSGPVPVTDEPARSSHKTRVYGIDGVPVHVKFFRKTLGRTSVTYDPRKEMEDEFFTLKEFEKSGFSAGRYRIVPALGVNEALDCALATVYVGGDTLLALIVDTLKNGRGEETLMEALDLTAGLLKKIHTVMPRSPRADGAEMFYAYLKSMLYLEEMGALDGFHRRITKGLSRWYGHKPLFEQRGVTVHGDANPSNFKIFNGVVYGFDVERSSPGRSALLDVGTMAAELRHHSAYLAEPGRAEPLVDRFLRAYAPSGKDQRYIRGLLPFFESRGFFKIAMLGYWRHEYRRYLVEQGTRCIEAVP